MEEAFVLNADQRAILETVARFVEKEVRPRAAALDAHADPLDCYCPEIIEKAHELGLRTMTLEEKWGACARLAHDGDGSRGNCHWGYGHSRRAGSDVQDCPDHAEGPQRRAEGARAADIRGGSLRRARHWYVGA